MARGINKVIVVGNLGSDPETRFMPSGGAVASFSIATSESWTDKQSGQKQERTEWHNISVFGRLAEICGEYLRKGSKVYVEGSLRTEKWQDKQGNDRYTTKIVAREMQMLDSRSGGTANFQGGQPAQQPAQPQQGGGYQGQQQGGYQQPPAQQAPPQQGSGFTAPAPQAPNSGFGSDDFDDDIPF